MLKSKRFVTTILCDIYKINIYIFLWKSGISVFCDLKEKILMPSLVGIKMNKRFVNKNKNYSEEII